LLVDPANEQTRSKIIRARRQPTTRGGLIGSVNQRLPNNGDCRGDRMNAIDCSAKCRDWHKADMPVVSMIVRFLGQSGHRLRMA
jgi:hypothetical protein